MPSLLHAPCRCVRLFRCVVWVRSASLALGTSLAFAQPAPAPVPAPLDIPVAEMIEALKTTPGVVGVDIAELRSGKNCFLAWFRDKPAAMAWFRSTMHQKMLDQVAPRRNRNRVPMAEIPEDVGPMFAAACLSPPTPATDGRPARSPRIGIELYAPLKGGVRFSGGSFAPDAFKALLPQPQVTGQPSIENAPESSR